MYDVQNACADVKAPQPKRRRNRRGDRTDAMTEGFINRDGGDDKRSSPR